MRILYLDWSLKVSKKQLVAYRYQQLFLEKDRNFQTHREQKRLIGIPILDLIPLAQIVESFVD